MNEVLDYFFFYFFSLIFISISAALTFIFFSILYLFCCGVVALLASLKVKDIICTTIVSLQPRTEAGKP